MKCAGNKAKSFILTDIYSIDTIIFENREWKKFVSREHKDLKKIMKRELDYYLNNDFEIYEILDNSFNKMELSVTNIDSLTKEMIKIVKMMKRKKIIDLSEVSSKTDLTYFEMLKNESDAISKTRLIYNKNRSELKTIFKKLNQNLIFIKEETLPLKAILPELKFKRTEINVYMDKYMDVLNKIVFEDSSSEYSIFVLESSNKIEKWRKQLDLFEKFIENIDAVARKEVGGFVALKSKDEDLLKYVKRYNEGIEQYKLNIENIQKLIKLF